jgi:hypothetical protein
VREQLRVRARRHRPIVRWRDDPGLLSVRRRALRDREGSGPFELWHCRRCRKSSGSAWAACDAENPASARVLEKAGLAPRGRYERDVVRPKLGPTPRPSLYFSRER